MSLENAKANLKEFGKELNLEGLAFDENNTCILGIDNTFSLHLTYEPNSDRLYLYSPILDGLPKDNDTKLWLYEGLLELAMLGGQLAGGGIGVAVPEELILMHSVIEMGPGTDASALRRYAPHFVQKVEEVRDWAQKVAAGQKIPPARAGENRPGGAQLPPASQGPGPGGKPGGFIKI